MTTARVVLLLVLTVVVVAFDAAIALGLVARSRGVQDVVVPQGSMIETMAADADYSRSYRVPVSSQEFPTIATLRRPEFARRMEVTGSGPWEIVYRGRLPALQYHVAYSLDQDGGQRFLTVTTVIHHRHWLGLLYTGGIRFIQWGLVPLTVSRLVERSAGP